MNFPLLMLLSSMKKISKNNNINITPVLCRGVVSLEDGKVNFFSL